MQAQPYRKRSGRRATAALKAMQLGRPRFMRHPMDTRRRIKRKARIRRNMSARNLPVPRGRR